MYIGSRIKVEKEKFFIPKLLNKSLKSFGGRNNFGRQTFFHKGGGSKIRYKLIDFCRS